MTLTNNLDLLMLGKEERAKAESKFLVSVILMNPDTIKYLNEQDIIIKKAKDIKVATNSPEEVQKKIGILNEIHETEIYKQDPSRINHNVIDIYKRIQYCKQYNIPYKKEDGSYEKFLFSEITFQQLISNEKETIVTPQVFSPVEEEMVTLEPEIAPIEFNFEKPNIEPIFEKKPVIDNKHIDINEYRENELNKEVEEAHTTTYDKVVADLAGLEQARQSLKNFRDELNSDLNFDTISFEDLDLGSESFGGR